MRGDIYTKNSQDLSNTLHYFPVSDPSYSASTRLAALQHQLHITTSSQMEMPNSHSWSNLIIPYHPNNIKNSNLPSNLEYTADTREEITRTESTKEEGKKKNPYSIEELLKKPVKKNKPVNFSCTGFQQPFGTFVTNEDFEKEIRQIRNDSILEKNIEVHTGSNQ